VQSTSTRSNRLSVCVAVFVWRNTLLRLIRGEKEGFYGEEQNCFQVWTGEPRSVLCCPSTLPTYVNLPLIYRFG
jgi:hypothetical protein